MTRRFRSSIVLIVLLMAACALVFAILALAIPQMIGQASIPSRIWFARNGAPLVVAAITVGIIGGAVLGFHLGYRSIEIDASEARIREGLGRQRVYRFGETRFVAQLTRTTTNGIPSGTHRALAVATESGTRTIRMAGFSPSRFDEIVHLLQHGGQAPAPVAPGATAPDFVPVVVEPPRTGRPLARRIVWIALAVLAGAAVVIGVLEPRVDGLIAMLVIAVLLGGTAAVVALTGRGGRVPQRIELTAQALTVDDWTAPLTELERVELAPPELTGGVRRLVAVRRDGARMSWLLGRAPAAAGASDPFPAYASLVTAVATVRPGEPLLRYMMR